MRKIRVVPAIMSYGENHCGQIGHSNLQLIGHYETTHSIFTSGEEKDTGRGAFRSTSIL